MPISSPRIYLSLFAIVLTLSVTVAWACQVPVFRFALERWEADTYSVVITPGSGGELSSDEEEVLEFLESVRTDVNIAANVTVKLDADSKGDSPGAMMDLFSPLKIPGLPLKPIWSGPATMENARNVVDSPSRRKIVKRLLAGESTIWLLVESGDAGADKAAAETLNGVIKEAPDLLKIPDGVITQDAIASETPISGPVDPENILQSDVPLKIDFSTVQVSRDDPAEQIFLQMLLNIEDDLAEFSKEPMVFPIFGRGRALEPLIGRGVTRDNALDYGGYLCGACSCEVKDQNPGMDLLIAANWDAALEGSQIIIDKVLPPLEGTAALTAAHKGSGMKQSAQTTSDEPVPVAIQINDEVEVTSADASESGGPNMTWLWLVFGTVFVVIAVGTVLIKKRAS